MNIRAWKLNIISLFLFHSTNAGGDAEENDSPNSPLEITPLGFWPDRWTKI